MRAPVAELAAHHARSYRRSLPALAAVGASVAPPSRGGAPERWSEPPPARVVATSDAAIMAQLSDLARARRLVVVETVAGRRWAGRIAVVGREFIELASRTPYRRRVALDQVRTVELAA